MHHTKHMDTIVRCVLNNTGTNHAHVHINIGQATHDWVARSSVSSEQRSVLVLVTDDENELRPARILSQSPDIIMLINSRTLDESGRKSLPDNVILTTTVNLGRDLLEALLEHELLSLSVKAT